MWRASAIQEEQSLHIIEEIPAPPIKYLVFEGGGIRGIAYAGVVEELEKVGLISNIEHVAGSSIGSVAALLIALGCTAAEIEEFLRSLSFEYFLEGEKPWPITPSLITKGKQYITILTNHSLSSGDRFFVLIEKIIETKLSKKDATFEDLARLVEKNTGYKYLSVTGSNISKCRLEVFNHETTPKMPIALAIRISASFPGIFKAKEVTELQAKEVEIRNTEGMIKEKIMEEVHNVYVDGGLMNNLPSFIFGDKKYLPEGFCFTEKGSNPSVLNIKVDTEEEVRQLLWNNGYPKPISGIADYSKKLLDGMQSRDNEIYEQYATNIIQVNDCGIDTLKFDITDLEKEKLIASGRQAALHWLENHLSEAYEIKVYQNQAEWLNKKTIEEVVQIKNAYQRQFINEFPLLDTESNASANQMFLKLAWFDDYLCYRFQQLMQLDGATFKFEPHINLCALKYRQWDGIVKREMEERLSHIEQEIDFLEPKFKDFSLRIEENHDQQHLHNMFAFDLVVYATKLEERLKWLKQTSLDLRNKLHRQSNQTKVMEGETCAWELMYFRSILKKSMVKKNFYLSQQANLISVLDQHLYQEYASYQTEEGVKAVLDLKNKDDLKIYVMACFMYFKFINSNDSLVKDFETLYKAIFLSEKVPTNLKEMGVSLQQQGVPLLLSAYRIEGLIKNLMRLDKKNSKESAIDLDYIFTALSPSSEKKLRFWKKIVTQPEEPNDIELDCVYTPFSHERSEKFLMFTQSAKMTGQLESETQNSGNSPNNTERDNQLSKRD